MFESDDSMAAGIFLLFSDIEKHLRISDSRVSLPKDYNTECLSLIKMYMRRIAVAFKSLTFEQVCDLMSEFEMYTKGVTEGGTTIDVTQAHIYRNSQHIEDVLEKEIVDLRAGIREKASLQEKLEHHCEGLGENSNKSILHARAVVALEQHDDEKAIESVYTLSDAPESLFTRRLFVGCEDVDPMDANRTIINEAALNVAMAHARLGKLQEAMHLINEHMRVSQQSLNVHSLARSLAALCQILASAVPGSLELQTEAIPATTPAEMHYIELEKLLKKLSKRSDEIQLPEISLFSKLMLAEFAVAHPKKLKVSSATIECDIQQNKDLPEYAMPGFSPPSIPCISTRETLDTCIYAKELAFETSLLSCENPTSVTKSSAGLFGTPNAAGNTHIQSSDTKISLESKQGVQIAHQIRAAAWQVTGHGSLSMMTSLGVLHSTHRNDATEISALSLLLINMYDQYGFDAIKKIASNEKFASLIQSHTGLQRSWDIIQQRRAVHSRQCRLAIRLAARVPVHPRTQVVTHIEHKVEVHEMIALAYLSGGYHEDADKAAFAAFTLARNACIPTYALRLLLLRGRIHIESGSWHTAMPLICSVLEQYRDMHADLIGAEASMYMAKIWSSMGKEYIQEALNEMHTSLPLLLAHAGLETRGIARKTLADLYTKQAGGIAKLATHPNLTHVQSLLCHAEADFTKIGDWKSRADVLHLASAVYHELGDVSKRDECASVCLNLRRTAETPPRHTLNPTIAHLH